MTLLALILPIALRPSSYNLQVGDVAPQDIQAPNALNYTSNVLTQKARENASRSVASIYLPADSAINRRQVEKLRVALDYIENVRLDKFATAEQKTEDLSRLNEIKFTPERINQIITLSSNRWDTVTTEALHLLEQVMRDTIHDYDLDDARRSISTLISYSLTQDQVALVYDLVNPFITPNSLFSQDQTEKAQKEAESSISPVTRNFAVGQLIIQHGQIITAEDIEALNKFGLLEITNNRLSLLGTTSLVLILCIFVGMYAYRRKPQALDGIKNVIMIAVTFLVFLYSARYLIPNRAVLSFVFPLSAFGLTIATLFNVEAGMIFSLVLSILAAYRLSGSLELILFYTISSYCGILMLGRGRRISSFLWTGLIIGLAGTAVIFAYRLQDPLTDWIGLATLSGAAFLNGVFSASLTLLFHFLFSQMLGLTTALQLLEISRPDHPLLKTLLRSAPGTYQHSLQVANLAEQAAEIIGADPLLTRVGALYHDVGKTLNPLFFIENQIQGEPNPHDDLDPVVSAATIIKHVPEGLSLAKKHNLPPRIQDFIKEHHGTLLTRYQYNRALEAVGNDSGKVNQVLFRYPGPKPHSRETALIMLADGCEARARAEHPKNETEIRSIVKKVMDICVKDGQLDETRLTLKDIAMVSDSFVSTLMGVYHHRISYPELYAEEPTKPFSVK
jgi:putative nucleotidyltransferase with HDIG domain